MQEKRKEWRKTIENIPREKLVFLDESGVNINLVRRYGRAVGKTRVVDSAPFSTPKNLTVLSAIHLKGQFACTEYEGGTTKERFLNYIENTLLPEIHEGDYVVMDNLRTHHCKGVEELIRSAGAIPLYLLPYSPDLNPIEKMWSKMKAILRRLKIRVKKNLISAVHSALNAVLPSDCDGWFRCAGC
ncbi:MAG: IS630 family transposase [Eubacterium sp.]|nr:IS630 family transposase [Eubacterium sp.]